MRFRAFLKSTDLSKALLLSFAITLPVLLSFLIGKLDYGMALALGALLCSSSDVSGSTRHKNIGILLSALLVFLVSLAGAYLNFNSVFVLPLLGVIFFSISYFAVFGFRASLIAFSGLFAMVLSFADPGDIQFYERALFMGFGGLFYLSLNLIGERINPRRQTNEYLSDTIDLTAKYIETRGKLISGETDRNELQHQLIELQTELNLKHETLRDILISARKNSGNSAYQRKRLLIFIQLVDVLELAVANPVNYEKLDRLLEKDKEILYSFRDLILSMASKLDSYTRYIRHGHSISEDQNILVELEKIQAQISDFGNKSIENRGDGHIMLQNLLDYQENQLQKIRKIERLLIQKEVGEIGIIKRDEVARFITPQDYDPKILLENLSFNSAIFKHSLRLAVVVMIGYGIGEYFALQNAYWILLTIIVIMRPSYGLTKTRSKQRTAGTLIGAAIAMGIVLLTQNPVIYSVLSVISLVTAFAMVQKNYKTSAIFITLSVVFIYALLEPNVLSVIQYRVIDTLIGAGLATIGNILLWPSWEFFGIKTVIGESVQANKNYLKEISNFYIKKGKVSTSYKLARKEGFLAMGNLSAAFQRMTQEPSSKQKNLDKIFELAVLNHSILSSLASLGTYIQNHTTTKASSHFQNYVLLIDSRLKRTLELLEDGNITLELELEHKEKAEAFFAERLSSFSEKNDSENNSEDHIKDWREAQLVYDQLRWLLDLATKLEKKTGKISF
jgi:uncharacterized membrane protein (TIGR01666 family)